MAFLVTLRWRGPADDGLWDGSKQNVLALDATRVRTIVAISWELSANTDIDIFVGSTIVDVVHLVGNVQFRTLPYWVVTQGDDFAVERQGGGPGLTGVSFSLSEGVL